MEPHRSHYADLSLFLLIVQFRSFRRAADHLDITVSAMSHRMKALETRLGVRLLNRTSRSVAPTAAGEALAQKVAAGLELIDAGLDDIRAQVNSSAGGVRINVMRDAVPLLLAPVMSRFTERFPLVEIEVAVDDHFVDVTAEGFDAGLRYSGTIPEDMVAAPLTGPLGWVAVASPAYFARAGRPETPEDLLDHQCIRLRTGRGQIYHWEFDRGDDHRVIDVPGRLIAGSSELSIAAALDGIGIVYCLEALIRPHLVSGRLQVCLPEWLSMGPPLAMYYPSRRQLPFGLGALIETIRDIDPTLSWKPNR
ncbi:MAG: LysR family transcriptional regulator [Ancalomicrobiaceae bacterium]|nr:LysR family transcriptional regulator [Ancalomicrobiaceae bacterium]